jgi:hypothetical protein
MINLVILEVLLRFISMEMTFCLSLRNHKCRLYVFIGKSKKNKKNLLEFKSDSSSCLKEEETISRLKRS